MLDFILSLSPVGPPALVRRVSSFPCSLNPRPYSLTPHPPPPSPLLFLLCPSPQTIAAIASMASLSDDAEGQIARLLTLSYLVTPLISLSVSGSIWAVGRSGVAGGA